MSAFVVRKEHIDALVVLAVQGPRERVPAPCSWLTRRWYVTEGRALRSMSADEVRAAAREASGGDVNRIGQFLISENVASVRYRYADSDPESMIPDWTGLPYVLERSRATVRPTSVEGLKAIDCYEYQSCEHPGWETSDASAFCESLRRGLIAALPGYSEANGWEWSAARAAVEGG